MKPYTVGFIFNKDLSKVLLIHKLHPEWQNGRVNGIGGKIEPGEESIDCIVREIREETGLITDKDKWIYAGKNIDSDWVVDFYSYQYHGNEKDAQQMIDEEIEWFDLNALPENLIPNLAWLIPLALDKLTHNEYTTFTVNYA